MNNLDEDISVLKFEEAMSQLEEIVKKLEGEDQSLTLEESVDLYKRGILLSDYCKNALEKAQQEIKILTISPEGELEEKPFKADEDDGIEGI